MEECIDGNAVSSIDGNLYWSLTVDAMDGYMLKETKGQKAEKQVTTINEAAKK